MAMINIGQDMKIDLPKLVDTRALIQANSGGGKSWLLRLIAEKSIEHVQTVILDPEGEFSTLREKHDILLAGREGEVPTDPRGAGLLARKLAELQVSAVIDLYDLSIPERRRYVRLFLESLVSIPKDLYHPMLIILDEGHMFCPERSAGEAESTQAVINLLSLGRKRGMCGILATQRLSKLHKDAEAECNNVFIGRTVQDIDQKRAAAVLGIDSTERIGLRDLDPGEFITFGPAISAAGVTRFKAGAVATTHPRAGERHKMTAPKASDAVKQLASALADLPQQAEEEARTLSDAVRQIRELKHQLRARPKEQVEKAVIKRVEVPALKEPQIKRIEAVTERLHAISVTAQGSANDIRTALQAFTTSLRMPPPSPRPPVAPLRPPYAPTSTATPTPRHHTAPSSLPEGERAILTAIAQYTDGGGADRTQLSILTGYKRSSRDTYLQRLRARGYVEEAGDRLHATHDGMAALGDFEPLPTGTRLQEFWLARLPEGEKRILQILVAGGAPIAVLREWLSDQTGYKRSSRDTYLQRLSARRLIVDAGKSSVRASPMLFD